jgi:succinyl-CoA synthetase beta subunit
MYHVYLFIFSVVLLVCLVSTHFHIFLCTGTNVDEAKRILKDSKLPIVSANDLDDAAKKAVASLR